MRTLRSVVAIVSTALLMACQSAVATGAGNQAPVPVSGAHSSQSPSAASSTVSHSVTRSTAPAAESGSSRKTWIIIGLIAAIAIVAVVLVSGGSDGGGIY